MLSLWIGGQPVPASRPRVSKFGVYYSKTYNRWINDSWKYVEDFDAEFGKSLHKWNESALVRNADERASYVEHTGTWRSYWMSE